VINATIHKLEEIIMLKVALIGYGYWGPNLAKNIFNSSKTNLLGICDKDSGRLEKAKKIYIEQTKYITDYHELLNNNDIDAIAVAVETEAHFRIAEEVLNSGKHLFIEKPFTSNYNDADELKKLADEKGLIIHVDHIMIFHPIIKKIKQLIDNDEIGDIIYFESSRMNLGKIKKDVSAMWDLAVHDLAVIDYLSNSKEPFYINAVGEKRYSVKETITFLTMRYEGFIAHLKSSWISPVKERRMIISGTKKMVVFDDMKNVEKLMIYDKGFDVSNLSKEYDEYAIIARTGDLLAPFIPEEDALNNSVEHFAECVEKNIQSLSNPDQAMRMIKILEEADEQMNL
jgi:predicted dehydrogenase